MVYWNKNNATKEGEIGETSVRIDASWTASFYRRPRWAGERKKKGRKVDVSSVRKRLIRRDRGSLRCERLLHSNQYDTRTPGFYICMKRGTLHYCRIPAVYEKLSMNRAFLFCLPLSFPPRSLVLCRSKRGRKTGFSIENPRYRFECYVQMFFLCYSSNWRWRNTRDVVALRLWTVNWCGSFGLLVIFIFKLFFVINLTRVGGNLHSLLLDIVHSVANVSCVRRMRSDTVSDVMNEKTVTFILVIRCYTLFPDRGEIYLKFILPQPKVLP